MEYGSFVAVFDSGVGGISVLREMIRLMPYEDFLFFGDSANAPYGTKTTPEVRRLTIAHAQRFIEHGAKALCIACNTATSAAVRALREMYPNFPIVGIEPAIKPASERFPNGRILVMATPMTIREAKFHDLLARYEGSAKFIPLACPGLMEYVENGELDSPEVTHFLSDLLHDYVNNVDAVVLGCTHYPFLSRQISDVLGGNAEIFDGAAGTARELRRRMLATNVARSDMNHNGSIHFENSGGEKMIALSHRLLEMAD